MSYGNNPHLGDFSKDGLGNPFATMDQYVTRGWIRAVNPRSLSCDVETERGLVFLGLALPHLAGDPEGGGGSVKVPRVGQTVVVQCGLGGEYITQIYAEPKSVITDPELTFHVTEADMDSFAPHKDVSNFRGHLPKDLLPGDWLEMGNQGQYLAQLDGGAAVLHATPFAQVRALQFDDTLQIAGRNLGIYTGFGNIKFEDHDGKKAVIFEGGTDQWTELKPGEEKWTIRGLIGGDAEGLIDFRIQDRRGQPVVKTVIEADGSTRNEYAGNRLLSIDGDVDETIGGHRSVDVNGLDSLVVHGGQGVVVEGYREVSVSQDQVTIVGQNRADMVNKDWEMSTGRFMRLSAGGNPLLGKPGDPTVDWSITNGSLIIDIGNPASLDTGKSLSGLDVTTYLGDMEFTNMMTGKYIVNTLLPDSVLLGADMGVAPLHLVIWEYYSTLMKNLFIWLDLHTHMSPDGMTAPPSTLFRPIGAPLVQPARTLKVAVGAQ